MFKSLIKVNALAFLLIGFMMTSCSKEDENVVAENYGFTETFTIQKSLNAGKFGCVEVVFPQEIELPDGEIIEVDSFEDAKEQLTAWKEANPDVEGRPQVVYPIEVITQEGETVSVDDKSELRALIKECIGNFPPRPRHFRACFRIQYPVVVEFPNGQTLDVETRKELKAVVRLWKQNNPNADEKPSLVYPIVIEYEDGSTQEINSAEELREAKRACRE